MRQLSRQLTLGFVYVLLGGEVRRTMSDETVMRSRLLIDGDGNGDDRRLSRLHKASVELVSLDKDEEKRKRQSKSFLLLSKQCALDEKKARCVRAAIDRDTERDAIKKADIQKEIEATRTKILAAKSRLRESRAARRHRMQYDAIARDMDQMSDRGRLNKQIQEAKLALESIKGRERDLDMKLEKRKKQFHVLVHSLQQLREIVKEDEALKNAQMDVDDEEDDEDLDEEEREKSHGRSKSATKKSEAMDE